MSNSTLKVKFNDGLILYGQYNGTGDFFHRNLFNSLDEAWSHNRNTEDGARKLDDEIDLINLEDVEIYTDYGSGKSWAGKACRITKQIDN